MPSQQTIPELQQRVSHLESENQRLLEKLRVAEGEMEYQLSVLIDIAHSCQKVAKDAEVIIPCDNQRDSILGIRLTAEAQAYRILTEDNQGGLATRLHATLARLKGGEK